MNLHNGHHGTEIQFSAHKYLDIQHLKVDDANATPMYLFVHIEFHISITNRLLVHRE